MLAWSIHGSINPNWAHTYKYVLEIASYATHTYIQVAHIVWCSFSFAFFVGDAITFSLQVCHFPLERYATFCFTLRNMLARVCCGLFLCSFYMTIQSISKCTKTRQPHRLVVAKLKITLSCWKTGEEQNQLTETLVHSSNFFTAVYGMYICMYLNISENALVCSSWIQCFMQNILKLYTLWSALSQKKLRSRNALCVWKNIFFNSLTDKRSWIKSIKWMVWLAGQK